MAENKIEIFGEEMPNKSELVFSDEEWASFQQIRRNGITTGIASAKIHNTIMRQQTLLAKIFAEVLVKRYEKTVSHIKPDNYETYEDYVQDLISCFNMEKMVLTNEVLGKNFGTGVINEDKLSRDLINGISTAPWCAESVKEFKGTIIRSDCIVSNNYPSSEDITNRIAPYEFPSTVYNTFINKQYNTYGTLTSDNGDATLKYYILGDNTGKINTKKRVFLKINPINKSDSYVFSNIPDEIKPRNVVLGKNFIIFGMDYSSTSGQFYININKNGVLTLGDTSGSTTYSIRGACYYDIIVPEVKNITIDGLDYSFDSGMKWEDWIETNYSTAHSTHRFDNVEDSIQIYKKLDDTGSYGKLYYNNELVLPTDTIVENSEYLFIAN